MFQQLRLHQRQLAVLGARRDKTGAYSVTSFWSSQSVFLIGPHTPATLGCWPGSSVWTNQTKVVKKSFPSSGNISKPNSAPKRCDRIGADFITDQCTRLVCVVVAG